MFFSGEEINAFVSYCPVSRFNAFEKQRPLAACNWNLPNLIGLIPFGIAGPGVLQGALEVGLEPIYQRYVSPVGAFYAGLAAVMRYHFTSLGRFVPYVELAGAAGGTDLRVAEQQTSFGFLLFGGVGLSYFVTDRRTTSAT